MEQKDLIKLRNELDITSEEYQRTKDHIEDIRLDTNNNQIGNLTDSIKSYKTETDRNLNMDRKLAISAIAISVASLLVTAASTYYAYVSVQISTDPQIEVFLKRTNINDKENFNIIVENNGSNDVKNLNLKSSVIHMNKSDFTNGEKNVSSVQNELIQENYLPKFRTASSSVFIENKKSPWVSVLYINMSYVRNIDQKQFHKRIAFFSDGFGIYSFEEIKDVPDMEPIIINFKQYNSKPLFDQSIQGQPF